MAITQVGSANTGPGNSSTTTLTLTKPSGVASGHLLVAVVTSIGTSSSITGPSGWTQIDTATSGGGVKMALWAKIAGGSEPSNYSWDETSLGSQRFVGTITAWDGVDVTSLTTAINTSTEHDIVGNTSTSTSQTSPTLGSSTYDTGRVFYARSARIANNTPMSFTESSGSASEMTDHGNNGSSSGISYSHIVARADVDFSGAGSKSGLATVSSSSPTDNVLATWVIQSEGDPADGDITSTTPSITSAFAGTREIPAGPIASTVPSVSGLFDGLAAPPEGPMVATTPSVSAAWTGAHDHAGPVSATTPSVSATFSGGVAPIGSISATLPLLSVQLGSETIPFGEHVIRVEAEHRAFSVIDDDPGLTPILRSQVWEQVVPTINAQAGEVYVSVVANDISASVPVSAPAGHATATATAFGAAVSGATAAPAGSAAATASASAPATALGVPGGSAAVSVTVSAPLSTSGALSGSVTVSAVASAPAKALGVPGGSAAVSVVANNATVTTSSSANAPAGLVSVSAVTNGASVALRPSAGLVSVSGAAQAATASTSSSANAPAGSAAVSATANTPSTAVRASAGLVSVSVAAFGVSSPRAGHAAVSATVYSATVATNSSTNAPAGHASATATANGATTPIQALSGLARVRVSKETLLKYVASIGNGTNTSYAVNHSFGSRDVIVRVYDNATYEEVQPKVTHTDTNNVTVEFAAAPASNAYRVVVLYSNV